MYGSGGADFTWIWRAGWLWLRAIDPYRVQLETWGAGYLDTAPLFYPFWTVLIFLPLQVFDLRLAASLQIGCAITLICYFAPHCRYLLALLSFPAFNVVVSGQITFWVYLGALLPVAAPLVLLKPSLFPAVFLCHSWRSLFSCVSSWFWVLFGCVVVSSFMLFPSWPHDWLHNVLFRVVPDYYGQPDPWNAAYYTQHLPALLRFWPGSLLLLVGFFVAGSRRWLWLVLLLIPVTPASYDLLLVSLVFRTFLGVWLFSAATWLVVIPYYMLDLQLFLGFPFLLVAALVLCGEFLVKFVRKDDVCAV
jgi:hypothetical protein